MSFIAIDADLAAAADEELDRACDLSWRDLSGIIPWGDSYEGVTPGGRDAVFERNYIWAGAPRGDICVEVLVHLPRNFEQGAKRTRLIAR